MSSLETAPEKIKPYLFHGVDLQWSDGGTQATGPCPFCSRDGKFSVEIATGLWKCWSCAAGTDRGGGNDKTFLRVLWEVSDESQREYEGLTKDRRLICPDTLTLWGVVQSTITGEWLVPGYDQDCVIQQLYRFAQDPKSGKRRLFATPGMSHQLFGACLYEPDKPTVYIAEGPWDGMALWEVLRNAKSAEGEYVQTPSEEASLLATANVVAVPGCNVFLEPWLPLFAGKRVVLLYDNDYPRKHPKTGKMIEPAALTGMRRATGLLTTCKPGPKEILYIKWGPKEYDPERPDGFDLRDHLSGASSRPAYPLSTRVKLLGSLLGLIAPASPEWMGGRTIEQINSNAKELECVPCSEWKELTRAWRKAMRWTEGLDRALSVMLASVVSTRAVGDQLWVKVIGPPSCGKTVLCEALSVARKYIFPKDTLTGLVSGYQMDGGKTNMSLAIRLKDKTLVINDGDTILQLPNRDQVLSQLRAFYGRNLRSQYGNKMSEDHEGINTTIILCGTESLRVLDTSELGERFVDCVIIDRIDEDEEEATGWRVANQADRDMSFICDGRADSRDRPSMVEAKQLTGGYVNYLREHARDLLDSIEASEDALRQCQKMATFVAYMRARPSPKQDEKVQREMAYRLISQHVRLAKSLAVVLNRSEIDEEVMRRTRQVALDTCRGKTLEIVKYLYRMGSEGAELRAICNNTNETDEKQGKLLKFLKQIGALTTLSKPVAPGRASPRRWKLTDRLLSLYQATMLEPKS